MLQAEGMAYQKVNPKDDVLHGSGKKVNVAAGEGWWLWSKDEDREGGGGCLAGNFTYNKGLGIYPRGKANCSKILNKVMERRPELKYGNLGGKHCSWKANQARSDF